MCDIILICLVVILGHVCCVCVIFYNLYSCIGGLATLEHSNKFKFVEVIDKLLSQVINLLKYLPIISQRKIPMLAFQLRSKLSEFKWLRT